MKIKLHFGNLSKKELKHLILAEKELKKAGLCFEIIECGEKKRVWRISE